MNRKPYIVQERLSASSSDKQQGDEILDSVNFSVEWNNEKENKFSFNPYVNV